ncbi:hypothetical protein [Aeoliella mucimassa]|uniref:Uncharacterized protein n=1 Tax=Aeoliella mucimassa TaxID=2527972 RepID=A0A518AMR2_9BACT|nr:hypothetical protein [Aeoliella mucimassa]QDU56019.1 hypothetical protein Pan181_22210 [Aeoliella mucimassa]
MNKNLRWWLYFTMATAVLFVLHLLRLVDTWNAYYLDGSREFGWPLTYIWANVWGWHLEYRRFLIDLLVMVLMAKLFADASVTGYRNYFRKVRNWGLPDST